MLSHGPASDHVLLGKRASMLTVLSMPILFPGIQGSMFTDSFLPTPDAEDEGRAMKGGKGIGNTYHSQRPC